MATFGYTLDNAGNRVHATEVLTYTTGAATTRNLNYTYDKANRLYTDFDSTSGLTTTYGYDNVGNRLTMQVGTATPTSYGYNELDQLRTMTSTNGSTTTINQYSYVRGNLVKVATVGSSSSTNYNWDSANRLIGVISGTQSSAYTYDSDGHRVAQTQGGTTTNYLWDSESNYGDVLLETNGAGAFQASYVMADGEIVSQNKGGVTSYLLKDGQGSTRALFSGGTLVTAGGSQIYSYTAFGSLQNQPATLATSYLYTGQQYDQPTGLYDLRARYYNPVDGRFLSQDTWPVNVKNPIELNRYVYVANNSINRIDPSGYLVNYALPVNWVDAPSKPAIAAGGFIAMLSIGAIAILIAMLALSHLATPPSPQLPGSTPPPSSTPPSSGKGGSPSFPSRPASYPSSVTMDEATKLANDFLGGDYDRFVQTNGGNYQFIRTIGNETRIARFDIKPGSNHVDSLGPHLNLERQINGESVPNEDPHISIDETTIRPGDHS